MKKKLIREWKKVFQSDLKYISYELPDFVEAPTVILLEGPLGSGKTTFTQEFAGSGETLSPSYSILSETNNILHADFYRIESANELIHLELELYLENKEYFIVEWGLKFFSELKDMIDESFNIYSLEIEVINESQLENPDKLIFPRNFSLYEVTES